MDNDYLVDSGHKLAITGVEGPVFGASHLPPKQTTRVGKKNEKIFSLYKIIDSENVIKVSQNPNKVARDTQGLPTVPHNDFGGLNFKGLASNYLLLMATSPYKVTFSKKNHEKIF